MGRPKQTLPWDDGTLLSHAVRTLRDAGADAVLVVAREPIAVCGCESVVVPHASSMAESLQAGIAHLGDDVPRCVVHLCDLPFVQSADVRRLCTAMTDTDDAAAAAFGETFGPPICLTRHTIEILLARLKQEDMRGGAKALLRSLPNLRLVPIPSAAFDIDTPDDYEAATRSRGRARGKA